MAPFLVVRYWRLRNITKKRKEKSRGTPLYDWKGRPPPDNKPASNDNLTVPQRIAERKFFLKISLWKKRIYFETTQRTQLWFHNKGTNLVHSVGSFFILMKSPLHHASLCVIDVVSLCRCVYATMGELEEITIRSSGPSYASSLMSSNININITSNINITN